MSVRAFTENSSGLLTRIKRQIDQGHIRTWSYDSDGDFTHTPDQWKNKAFLRPDPQGDKLRLTIVRNTSVSLTREIFAVYHGRFVEMLIKHVPDYFTSTNATPEPMTGDSDIED